MRIVQLTASRFVGSVERQILGLSTVLPNAHESLLVSFREGGLCAAYLDAARALGLRQRALTYDTPHFRAARRELLALLREEHADVLCCRGYKASLLGLWAARRAGIPVVAVSHGWTGQNARVRLYEFIERRALRRMDRVVCVSEAQAQKVRRGGVPAESVVVIHDAVAAERFAQRRVEYGALLRKLFPRAPRLIVGAAGRLSREKGFELLIDAAAQIQQRVLGVGFVLWGDGPLKEKLAKRIERRRLEDSFVLAGHRTDFDAFLPHVDLLALPSFTEGLPNVVLEAFAAGVPVVATAVGGTPAIVQDGVNGLLVPPGDAAALAAAICRMAAPTTDRRALGERGSCQVLQSFTFAAQALAYEKLLQELVSPLLADGCRCPERRLEATDEVRKT